MNDPLAGTFKRRLIPIETFEQASSTARQESKEARLKLGLKTNKAYKKYLKKLRHKED
jgi:hypothetical protein